MVVPRWGEVTSVTPFIVRLDAGRGIIPSPASTVETRLGDRVLVLRWGVNSVVVGKAAGDVVLGGVWMEWTTLPWVTSIQTVLFQNAYGSIPSVQAQVIGGNGAVKVTLLEEVRDDTTYYTGAKIQTLSGSGTSIAFQAVGRV